MRDSHRPKMLQAPLASTITSVLKTVFIGFSEHLGVTSIYDPGLSIKTTTEGRMIQTTSNLRDIWRKTKQPQDEFPTYPIFSWKRDPIGLADPWGAQASYGKIVQQNAEDGSVLDVYAGSIATINVNWRYITQNIAEMEQFEIMYLSKQHIHSFFYVDMLFFDQGPFKFELVWNDAMNNLQTNDEDFSYVSVGGELKITGPMIVILGQTSRLERIVFRLYTTSEKSPICEVPLPLLVSHSVLEMERVIHVNTEGDFE